jgi:hypothetical protein
MANELRAAGLLVSRIPQISAEVTPELTAEPAAAVVVTSQAYETLARVDKARLIAKLLHRGGVPSVDAANMTAEDWKQFHAGMKAKGILGPNSTVPSGHTIAMILVEMRRLEAAARPVIAPRGYASIAPGIAVRVRRRRAA